MSTSAKLIIFGMAALCVTGCSKQSRPQVDLMDRSRDIFLLLRYDTNNDRQISRDEMDAGLKRDYDAADANHDGKLEPDEVQAENRRRWNLEGPQSSPLMDWNMDSNVNPVEFSGAVHSLFTTVDKDNNNIITVQELQSPRSTSPTPLPARLDPRGSVPGGPSGPTPGVPTGPGGSPY